MTLLPGLPEALERALAAPADAGPWDGPAGERVEADRSPGLVVYRVVDAAGAERPLRTYRTDGSVRPEALPDDLPYLAGVPGLYHVEPARVVAGWPDPARAAGPELPPHPPLPGRPSALAAPPADDGLMSILSGQLESLVGEAADDGWTVEDDAAAGPPVPSRTITLARHGARRILLLSTVGGRPALLLLESLPEPRGPDGGA